MGSGQGKNRSQNSITGLIYLQNLIPNVEVCLSGQIKTQLEKIKLKMPNISDEIVDLYNYFTQDRIDCIKYSPEDYEHLNILSTFQKQLLQPPTIKNQSDDEGDQVKTELKIKYIQSLRLLDIKSLDVLKSNQLSEFNWICVLIKGMKNYCILANALLEKCQDEKELQWIIYVTLWEHYSYKLSGLSDQYSLSQINQAFDKYYHSKLRPQIKVETLGAKIWGGQVKIDKQFAINQILQGRQDRKSDLPLCRIAKVLMEMSIDIYNLQLAGSDEFIIPKLIQKLQEQTRQLYDNNFDGSYEDFFKFWQFDNQYILTIFPEWIIENYVDTILFEFVEDLFYHQILKLTPEEQLQIKNTYMQDYQIQPILLDTNELELYSEYNLKYTITFDQFLISQQEPTISIITKKLKMEKKDSDILKSNTTVNSSEGLINHQIAMKQINLQSIGEQVISDIQSQSQSSHFLKRSIIYQQKLKNLSLIDFENIARQYDKIKFPIQSRIEARNHRIKIKNKDITRVNYEFRSLFSFENQQDEKKQQQFLESLLNKNNQSESIIESKESIKLIAEMILE